MRWFQSTVVRSLGTLVLGGVLGGLACYLYFRGTFANVTPVLVEDSSTIKVFEIPLLSLHQGKHPVLELQSWRIAIPDTTIGDMEKPRSALIVRPETIATWEDLGVKRVWPKSVQTSYERTKNLRAVISILNPDVQLVKQGVTRLYQEDVNFTFSLHGSNGWAVVPETMLWHTGGTAGVAGKRFYEYKVREREDLVWKNDDVSLGVVWTYDSEAPQYLYRNQLLLRYR